MTATAAVWHGPETGFQVVEVPLPELAEGETLVRVDAATLCGSDLHTITGDRDTPVPTVLGHEMVGEVISTRGAVLTLDGSPVRPGLRVTWTIGDSCSRCPRCRAGFPQKCVELRKYGHAAMTGRWELSGGLATHCHLLAGTGIVAVGERVTDPVAAPANCATATVVCAVRTLRVHPGDSALVSGCGMLGLTAVAYLRAIGVSTVLACDVDPARRDLAAKLGAIPAAPAELAGLVADHTGGQGVSVAVELSGSNAAIGSALAALAIGGRLGLVGSVFPTPGLDLVPETVVRRLLTITGVHNYAPDDLVEAVRFLDEDVDRVLFDELTLGPYRLDQLDEAVAVALEQRPPRVLITPHGERS